MYYAVKNINCFTLDEQLDEREDIMKLLSENGVDVNEADDNGISPLHLAVSTVYSNMLCIIGCLLYNLQANTAAKTATGAMPLHWACRSFNQTMIILHSFLKRGLDINIADEFGSTALHWAVWFREISVARLLLQRGIDPSLKDKNGESPADLARKVHLDTFIELLGNYKTPLYKGLDENIGECSENDPIFACKQLRYVRKINGKIADDEYTEHVKTHQSALKSSIDTVMLATNMGLYHDIEENDDIASLLSVLMHMVAVEVSKQNPLFTCTLQLAGSNFEGTKVNLPDEFDYLWKLNEFAEAFYPVESDDFPLGFIKLRIKTDNLRPKFVRYINLNGDLDCKLLLEDFFHLVNEKLKHVMKDNLERFRGLICADYLNEIAYSIDNLTFYYYGRHAKSLSISVDIVPTIDLGAWKPEGFREEEHILLETLGDKWECSIVFKTPDRVTVKDFTLYFRLSFAFLEQSILKRIPYCVKKGYILLKSLAESKYSPKCVDHDNMKRVTGYITSYQMKTAFLWELELERRENGTDIDVEALSREESRKISLHWAYRILSHLEKRFKALNMPSYFDLRRSLIGFSGLPGNMVDPDPNSQQVSLIKKLLNIYEEEERASYD